MPEETKPVEREAFERWARTWFDGEGEDPIFFDPSEECYSRHAVHSSWMAWQASASAALERAETRLRCMGLETSANVVRALKGRG